MANRVRIRLDRIVSHLESELAGPLEKAVDQCVRVQNGQLSYDGRELARALARVVPTWARISASEIEAEK